ncbi:hypothetical protein ACHAPB_001330 [Verticillium nonalfalfae]
MPLEKLVRITTLIPRKKGLSKNAFYKHWTEYHTTDEAKALGEVMAKAAGRPMLEYDGMSDAYVKDFKTFEDAFRDPEYLQKIRPDELAFIDVENLQMTIGYDWLVVENGKKLMGRSTSK